MLDDRKKRILQAIVDEYVNTAEPVSSGAISKKKGLDFSSATIRNEMSELEKSGYLEKTHTSSGRIPSVKGYRLYVDELLKEDNISLEEIKYIKEKLQIKADQIEDLTKIASNTLSEITHYTTVAIGPKVTKQIIKEIKFVLLGSRMLMAVILTNTGMPDAAPSCRRRRLPRSTYSQGRWWTAKPCCSEGCCRTRVRTRLSRRSSGDVPAQRLHYRGWRRQQWRMPQNHSSS